MTARNPNAIAEERLCIDCGERFAITEGERSFLIDKFGADYQPPKRCRDCRREKKQRVAERAGP